MLNEAEIRGRYWRTGRRGKLLVLNEAEIRGSYRGRKTVGVK